MSIYYVGLGDGLLAGDVGVGEGTGVGEGPGEGDGCGEGLGEAIAAAIEPRFAHNQPRTRRWGAARCAQRTAGF